MGMSTVLSESLTIMKLTIINQRRLYLSTETAKVDYRDAHS
jgi:hypothetical protein